MDFVGLGKPIVRRFFDDFSIRNTRWNDLSTGWGGRDVDNSIFDSADLDGVEKFMLGSNEVHPPVGVDGDADKASCLFSDNP